MKKQLGVLVIVLLGLLALAPFSYAQEPKVIDDVAPFWAKIFQGFYFSGTQADYNCRSTWECVKDSNGLYRYDCYASSSSSNGCLCYRTSDPSKCKANQPSGTITTTQTTTSSQCQPPNNIRSYCASNGSLIGWYWSECKYISAECTTGPCVAINSTNAKCTYVEPSCSDSDGGTNYLKKGIVTWGSTGGSLKITNEDKCYSSYVLTEWDCLGKDPVGNSVSCPNGCANGACTGAAPTKTITCTEDNYQCAGNKIQRCVKGSLESTYWSDWFDCAPNACQTESTGSPVCITSGQNATDCIGAGGPNFPGGKDCCAGLKTDDKGFCNAETTPLPGPNQEPTPAVKNTTKSISFTLKEWLDSSSGQRLRSLCQSTTDCETYDDLAGTGKEYSVGCKSTSRIQSKLQEDIDKVCESSGTDKYLAVGGGAAGAAAGCAYGAALGAAAAGLGAIPGCIVGAITASTIIVTTVEGIHNTLQINCQKRTVPSDAGACIAVPAGGESSLDQFKEDTTLAGVTLPLWGWLLIALVAIGIIVTIAKPK